MAPFDIIVAVDKNFGIGKEGRLPWHLRADLKHFRALTTTASPGKTNAVVMGRKTWESLPTQFRPLPGRINLVLSHDKDLHLDPAVLTCDSLERALDLLRERHPNDLGNIFVMGGAQVYKVAIASSRCQNIFITEIMQDFACDTFFPKDLGKFKSIYQSPVQKEGSISFRFTQWIQSVS